jgi:hypothetical protein
MNGRTSIRRFSRQYNCDLISPSHEGIILGTMVWDPAFALPKFEHPGMPDHILDGFHLLDEIDESKHISAMLELKGTPLINGEFGSVEVQVDVENVASLGHPQIGNLNAQFDMTQAEDFRFSDIKVRRMENLTRVQFGRNLDSIKESNWKAYRQRLRRAFLITELYYGSVEVDISRELEAGFEAKVAETDLEIAGRRSVNGTVSYRFSNDKVPFAMKIERVRSFA